MKICICDLSYPEATGRSIVRGHFPSGSFDPVRYGFVPIVTSATQSTLQGTSHPRWVGLTSNGGKKTSEFPENTNVDSDKLTLSIWRCRNFRVERSCRHRNDRNVRDPFFFP